MAASCSSRFNHSDDEELAQAVEASEYEFAYQLQVREVISLSDFDLAFDLQLREALRASAYAQATDDHGELSSFELVDNRSVTCASSSSLWISACQQQPCAVVVGVHREGKEPSMDTVDGMDGRVSKATHFDLASPINEPCIVCLDSLVPEELFYGFPCSHMLCIPCLVRHVQFSVLEGKMLLLPCIEPRCQERLPVEACAGFLPSAMADAWRNLLIEQEFAPEWQRVYCPFKDCSAILVKDDAGEEVRGDGARSTRSAECPECNRLFCMECMVPWHGNLNCDEFQRLPMDEKGHGDILLKHLAQEKKWRRCARCKVFIELSYGCNHMKCRCGQEFCYICGGEWSNPHICDDVS